MVEKLVKGLLKPNALMPLVLGLGSFIVLYLFVPGRMLSSIVNSMDVAAWLVIMWINVPQLWHSLRKSGSGETPHRQNFIMGVILLWTAIAVSRVWVIGSERVWFPNYWLPALCFWTIGVSGYYFVKIPGSTARYVVAAIILTILIIAIDQHREIWRLISS